MSEDPNFEETSLFDFVNPEEKKETKKKAPLSAAPVKEKKEVPAALKNEEPNQPVLPGTPSEGDISADIKGPSGLWKEKFWEYNITKPSQAIKDDMKEQMLAEGFSKREANRVFKGLFFKEKVFNTKVQAVEFLKSLPTTYAVKYKIGIEPSPQMISLQKRLADKERLLKEYKENQETKRFTADFISCPHCHSKINRTYITPPLCPLCQGDMRPETVIKRLTSLEKAVSDLKTRYERTARKYNSKFTGGEKWIIRTINPFTADDN